MNAEGGSASKKQRVEPPDHLQSFVQSAGDYYREWEEEYAEWERKYRERKEADTASVEKGCDVPDVPFLKLSADPLNNYDGSILLWVRDCYRDLKTILETAAPSASFIVKGTSGIGKSYFSVFWICYLAERKKEVAWKVQNRFFVPDFSHVKAAKAYGPVGADDSGLRKVLYNRDAWLVIDGEFKNDLCYKCHILLPCSAQKENYKEFEKGLRVTTLYMPVWEDEEICGFVDAFDKQRNNYSNMGVPDKGMAIQRFEHLGGVPRYVLDPRHTEPRKRQLEVALDFFIEEFDQGDKRDAIVHIQCERSTDKNRWDYRNYVFTLASTYVKLQVQDRFHALSELDALKFLRAYASSSLAGSRYGYMFELVAHTLMRRGGKFRMKKVFENGEAKDVEPLNLPKMKTSVFKSLRELEQLEEGTYYRPRSGNLKSIDALLHPNLLLQYFSYNQGVHGYLLHLGVSDAHRALNLS